MFISDKGNFEIHPRQPVPGSYSVQGQQAALFQERRTFRHMAAGAVLKRDFLDVYTLYIKKWTNYTVQSLTFKITCVNKNLLNCQCLCYKKWQMYVFINILLYRAWLSLTNIYLKIFKRNSLSNVVIFCISLVIRIRCFQT